MAHGYSRAVVRSSLQLAAAFAAVLGLLFASVRAEAQRMEELTVGLVADAEFTAIALAPSDPNVAYVAGSDGWVYATDDRGQTWTARGLSEGRTIFYGSARYGTRIHLPRINGGESPQQPSPSSVFNFSNRLTEETYFEGLPNALSQLRADRVIRRSFDRGLGWTNETRSFRPPLTHNHLRLSGGRFRANAPGYHSQVIEQDRVNTAVRWLAVNPRDPDECFAATADGLYRTRDQGASWVRVYWDMQPHRRDVVHVVYSPNHPGRVVAATRGGLRISTDESEFQPAADPLFASWSTRHVLFDPRDADQEILITGRVYGRSVANQTPQHLDWQSVVIADAREALFDPSDPNTILVRADAGMWITHDGGASFERAGGALFIGANVTSIAVDPAGRHFMATTDRDLWESFDGGDTWYSVSFGAYDVELVRVAFDLHSPGTAWLIGAKRVVRIDASEPTEMSPDAERLYLGWMSSQPTFEEAMEAATRQLRLRREDVNRYARRAAWSTWMPMVTAGFRARDLRADASIDARFAGLAGEFFEDVFNNRYERPDTAFMITAGWGLARRSHSGGSTGTLTPVMRERAVQDWTRMIHLREQRITERVGRLYSERARLMAAEFADSTREARSVQMRALRLRELTSHLSFLTDDLIPPPP